MMMIVPTSGSIHSWGKIAIALMALAPLPPLYAATQDATGGAPIRTLSEYTLIPLYPGNNSPILDRRLRWMRKAGG